MPRLSRICELTARGGITLSSNLTRGVELNTIFARHRSTAVNKIFNKPFLLLLRPCENLRALNGNVSNALRILYRGVLLCLLISSSAWSQRNVEVREQTWLGYFHQSRLTDRSGLWLDVHLRLNDDFIKHTTVSIIRTGYIYYFNDRWRFIAGYAYANRYNQSGVKRVPEHRSWQQLQWLQRRKGFNLTQALRVEQRFRAEVLGGELTGDYNFNWRFRYNVTLTIPLKGRVLQAQTPFLLVGNEVMANAAKGVGNKFFDQNRAVASLGYQFSDKLNAHLGYMFIVQQETADRYLNIHVARVFVIHNLDLRNPR